MRQTPAILAGFTLSDAQSAAAMAREQDVAVTAGAGTGKTRTLVARYLALLADGMPLRRIVAVTFTRKAAREMRNRVRQEIGTYLRQADLEGEEKEAWQNHYNTLDAARIGTIHNLCAEILRAHPAEVGIDPQFSVLDETQSALLLQEAVEATLAWAVEMEEVAAIFDLLSEQGLLELITVLVQKRLTVGQVMEQLPAGNIVQVWQARLEESQAAALEQLLSNPAFKEAKGILERNQAHNAEDKAEVQRRIVLEAFYGLESESAAGKIRNLQALDRINLTGGSQKSWPGGKAQLAEVKAALKELRGMFRERPLLSLTLNGQDQVLGTVMPAIYLVGKQALDFYQGLKSEREGLDFDDLEALAIRLLEEDEAVHAYWQSQIKALLVDEFQDTNDQQNYFMHLLCPTAGKLFIVGDAKQSIYRFRGADVTVFAQEKARIEEQNGSLIDLDISYRAQETLLKGMNLLLRPILSDPAADLPPWIAPFTPLRAGRKGSTGDLAPPLVEFHLTVGNKPEALPRAAAALARRLTRLHREQSLDYGDMAVLCRASGSFQYYEDAFDGAGIPYLTVAGKGFYERPEVRDLINALQAIADPHDDVALTGLLRSPACGLSDVFLYRLARERRANESLWDCIRKEISVDDAQDKVVLQRAVSLIGDLNRQAGRVATADLLKQFLDRSFYRAILRKADQPRALRNVAKLLDDIQQSELVNVNEFLEYAQIVRESGARTGEARVTSGGSVQIMSIHAAKGLEFPVVVLGDAASGSFRPAKMAVDPYLGILLNLKNEDGQTAASYRLWMAKTKQQDEAEINRLLYVALTRAEHLILISGHVQQSKTGRLSWHGWLGDLAGISGLVDADLGGYDEEGDKQHEIDCSLQETEIVATFYEPLFPAQEAVKMATVMDVEADRALELALREPLALNEPTVEKGEEQLQYVWQVIPTTERPSAPAWVIGSLVHSALALWRFPGAGFEAWVAARAGKYGITDERQLGHAARETTRLLRRFQESALFQEMNGATRRYHELPFSCWLDGRSVSGVMDALYHREERWTVVDFKTDRIRDEAGLRQLLARKDYKQQLLIYQDAVAQLLGEKPGAVLCLLNYAGGTRLVTQFGDV